ncbi:MAG: hypothetical protein EOO88_22780, partial [Pedobacter sp.]
MKYMRFFYCFLFLILGYSTATEAQFAAERIEKIIGAGDIRRTSFTDTARINLYQGNGRFGSSYGSLGLHNNPYNHKNTNAYGQTQYMHVEHWVRAKFNADYLIPPMKIYWSKEPAEVSNYSQHQSFYTGLVSTSFKSDRGRIAVETWFDQIDRNLSGITIEVQDAAPDVVVDPLEFLNVHYGQKINQDVKIIQHQKAIEIQLSCKERKSSFFLTTNSDTRISEGKVILTLHAGRNDIQLSFREPVEISTTASKDRTLRWWNDKWANTGVLSLPDDEGQNLWVRSMGYILSTVNEDKKGFPAPMGFTGNLWPFSFPQDLSYIHSVLLSTGNIDIAKAWVEQFAENIDGMKAYTKRLYGVDGVFLPWVFPYGSFEGYHDPSPPNIYNFEIHNSGYLCRMAYETAKFVDDKKWADKYAVDLIKETALFYKNITKQGPDGLWHVFITPSMGQDEMGGPDQKNYLCALLSAKYCFSKAVELNLDPDGTYIKILSDGLAFPVLESGRGIYLTSEAVKEVDLGKQKHPVQLNELAYLPLNQQPSKQARAAYTSRYEITQDAGKPHFYGWTLGEFLLAGSRLGDLKGWTKDWENITKSAYTD